MTGPAPTTDRPPSRHRARARAVVLLALVALLAVGVAWGIRVARSPVPPAGTGGTDGIPVDPEAEAFSRMHWETPIPPQGPPPLGIAAPARGIAPEDCAGCHYAQYLDWRDSWHANAMGPGVLGQFPAMDAQGRGQCLRCHAPLGEQWAALPPPEGAGTDAPWAANPDYVPELAPRGVTCAACHLRRHVRHAPPREEQANGSARTDVTPAGTLLHGTPVRTPHFRASEFCMSCHQHGPDTLHVNGKAIENTYREWLASPAAARGETCQSCHMPGGRHRWRGIHDPEITRAGVTVTATVTPEAPRVGDELTARLELLNSGVGHAFPTYTTPAVYLRAALLDAEGRVLPDRFAERTVQRRLDMSTQPWSETFDTRLAPGATAVLDFAATVPKGAATLYLWVWVEPDQFYAGFFRGWLAAGAPPEGAPRLREALRRAEVSGYRLWGRRIPVSP